MPQVFVQRGAHHLGGCSDVEGLHKEGKLLPFLFPGAPTGGAAQTPAQSSGAAASDSAATPVRVVSLSLFYALITSLFVCLLKYIY